MGVVDEEREEGVPSSTHGLLGLVEHALAHQEQASLTGPIAVHCRLEQKISFCKRDVYSSLFGKNIKLFRGKGNIMAAGENIT